MKESIYILIKNKNFSRATAFFFAVLIIVGSSIPSKNLPKAFELSLDKLLHCAEYFVFGYFLFNWIVLEFDKMSTKQNIWITIVLGSAMGILDENYQRLTPGRKTNVWDWVLDTVGIILVVVLVNYLMKKKIIKNKALN